MVLLRRVIGDALRARRQGQHRTLREVSTAANVSLGYLSEIERGQKEASSELLAAICEALGARLSEVLGEVSDTLLLAEEMEGVLVPVDTVPTEKQPVTGKSPQKTAVRTVSRDGDVSVSVRLDSPLKATLRTTRQSQREVVYAA
jgi:transcriptional regulator with XRE-family HTH domain